MWASKGGPHRTALMRTRACKHPGRRACALARSLARLLAGPCGCMHTCNQECTPVCWHACLLAPSLARRSLVCLTA
eukprot:14370674-Alexandrium_andersonii.AAC.1